MSKQAGPLSKQETDYIVSNFKRQSIEEMAEHLNRTEDTVKKKLLERGLWKEKTSAEIEDEGRLKMILWDLAYWPSIVEAYEPDEVEYYENNWIAIIRQLNEDVSYTEHMYVKDWIQLEIEKKRLLSRQKETRQSIRDLMDQIRDLEQRDQDTLSPIEQAMLNQQKEMLVMMSGAEGQHIKSLDIVNGGIKNISAKVKADREQRRTKETSKDTYWGYVECLNDEKYRLDESYSAELGRLAQKKAKDDLMGLTEFIDGTVDHCMLNEDTMNMMDEGNNGD